MIKTFTLVILTCLSCSAFATRPECQSLADKLENIQSQQRLGYSNLKGQKLAERERKAREKWWDCQNKRNKLKRKQKSKKTKKAKPFAASNKGLLSLPTKPLTNNIRLSSKYKGRKQQMWLNYYQQPDGCAKPKKLQVFAFCMEDRQKQQQDFEQGLLASKE